MIEAVFRDMIELEEFNDQLEQVGVMAKQEYYLLDDIKREVFISAPDLIFIMNRKNSD